MSALKLVVVIALTFSLSSMANADPQAAISAYHKLTSTELEAKRVASLPADAGAWTRVDVSEKARSASFGHSTTLIVSPTAETFYIEYGRSTNRPRRTFGPFAIQ